jgi:hypothetical protein
VICNSTNDNPWKDTYKSLWKAHGKEILEKGSRVAPIIITGARADYYDELRSSKKSS